MPTTKKQRQEKEEARERLRSFLPPGSKVYCVLQHVSRSGMTRRIDFYQIDDEGKQWLSYLIGKALGYRLSKVDDSLIVPGCGMDVGFHVVHSLSYALHGMDTVGEDAKKAHDKGRPFKPTASQYRAGYSLVHEWL